MATIEQGLKQARNTAHQRIERVRAWMATGLPVAPMVERVLRAAESIVFDGWNLERVAYLYHCVLYLYSAADLALNDTLDGHDDGVTNWTAFAAATTVEELDDLIHENVMLLLEWQRQRAFAYASLGQDFRYGSPQVFVLDGEQAGRSLYLKEGVVVGFGRKEPAELTLTDEIVSRFHGTFEFNGEGLLVRDFGSTNGIYHRGIRIEDVWIKSGETFSLGDRIRLLFSGVAHTLDDAQQTLMLPTE